MSEFGDELRSIREQLGYTQVEFATKLGVHPITLARWELGTRTPHAGPSILKKDVRELILDRARTFPKSRDARAGKRGPKPKTSKGRGK